jgi:putative ABC transport system substrate-binding protein
MTKRRELLIAFGCALAAPVAVYARPQNKVCRVGFLSLRRIEFVDSDYYYGPFRSRLRELGYVEGKNLIIEWRSAEGKSERLPALAAELVNLKVDVIVVANTPSVTAAQKATTTIPIVMGNSGDPVANGFVKSLARPGGNITGLSQMGGGALVPKRLELLLEMTPKVSRLALLMNPSNSSNVIAVPSLQDAAQKRGVTILRMDARTPEEIEQAIAAMRQQNAGALLLFNDGLFLQQIDQINHLIAKYRLPAIAGNRQQAGEGMLITYGVNAADQWRNAAVYVDKIFKGAKPADLPIEQPTKFDLIINERVAKSLGLTIPPALRISATEIIK